MSNKFQVGTFAVIAVNSHLTGYSNVGKIVRLANAMPADDGLAVWGVQAIEPLITTCCKLVHTARIHEHRLIPISLDIVLEAARKEVLRSVLEASEAALVSEQRFT